MISSMTNQFFRERKTPTKLVRLLSLAAFAVAYFCMGPAPLLAQASQSGENPSGVARAAPEVEQAAPAEPRTNPFGRAAAPVETQSAPLFVMPAPLQRPQRPPVDRCRKEPPRGRVDGHSCTAYHASCRQDQ